MDAMHFDARVEQYDRARPPYPESMWRRLADLGLLRPGLRVLDLGAGTGQATARFSAAGADVTAVEPGPALADLLRRRLPDVPVRVETAESVRLRSASFDLAVAATAVHWLDLAVVLPKLHDALAPGGHLAVWRNVYGDPRARSAFRDRVQQIVARRDHPPQRSAVDEFDIPGWSARLARSGDFTVVETGEWWWHIELDSARVRDLFSTFSDWTEEEAEAAADAAADLGGMVTEHYGTWLIVLRRVDRASQRLHP